MDNEKAGSGGGGGVGGGGGGSSGTERTMSQGESEALKKCLEENKGDHTKCKSKVEAFQSSSSSDSRKNLGPLRLGRGSLTDV